MSSSVTAGIHPGLLLRLNGYLSPSKNTSGLYAYHGGNAVALVWGVYSLGLLHSDGDCR